MVVDDLMGVVNGVPDVIVAVVAGDQEGDEGQLIWEGGCRLVNCI